MKIRPIFLAAMIVAASSAFLCSAETPESADFSVAAAFGRLAGFNPAPANPTMTLVPSAPAAQPDRLLQVSAAVSLEGHNYDLPPGIGNAFMTVTGFIDIRDQYGEIVATRVPVEYQGLFQISSEGSISGYAHLNVPFPIYKNGQTVGSGTIGGDVLMSGFVFSNNYALIRGQGRLQGTALVKN